MYKVTLMFKVIRGRINKCKKDQSLCNQSRKLKQTHHNDRHMVSFYILICSMNGKGLCEGVKAHYRGLL